MLSLKDSAGTASRQLSDFIQSMHAGNHTGGVSLDENFESSITLTDCEILHGAQPKTNVCRLWHLCFC